MKYGFVRPTKITMPNPFKLTILAGCIFVSTHGFGQQYVPPPPSAPPPGNASGTTITPPKPSRPSPGTVVYAPPAPEVKFRNGARVVVYRDEIVLIEPNGRKYTKKRPFPDVARSPWGCTWLRNYLDTRDPYTRNWGDNLIVYLKRCMGFQ